MTATNPEEQASLRRLIEGYQVSQAIHVAATLGIADLLAEAGRSCADLAMATDTHAPTLYRLLRALASVDLLREREDQSFELTRLGQLLRTDVPESVAGWAAFIGRPYYWQAWAGLLDSVRSGRNAFEQVHGCDVWRYRSTRPDESAIFDRAMSSLSRQSNAALLAGYDFGSFRRVVDVGGGNGALLAAILAANVEVEGVLFDQPHVVSRAAALLEQSGVSQRCEVVGGNFFEQVPGDADAYVLRAIVHDWDDVQSARILAVVRRATRSDARLLLIERVIAAPNQGRDTKFSDLNMLVGPGGGERTRGEYAALLAASGFALVRVVDAGAYSVIEAVPA